MSEKGHFLQDFVANETLAASANWSADIAGATEVKADEKSWQISVAKA